VKGGSSVRRAESGLGCPYELTLRERNLPFAFRVKGFPIGAVPVRASLCSCKICRRAAHQRRGPAGGKVPGQQQLPRLPAIGLTYSSLGTPTRRPSWNQRSDVASWHINDAQAPASIRSALTVLAPRAFVVSTTVFTTAGVSRGLNDGGGHCCGKEACRPRAWRPARCGRICS